ncbi:thioesterase thiol ester dehydrase-isomerase [Fusarium coicis]|nr:thioesterase thiol ester dehydrase-isomerase [Fusarium coicis]
MKLTLATLTLVTLAAATPPPEPVVLKPVPERASSGCYHYILATTMSTADGISVIPKPNNCCLPRLCACKDGNYYQFNEDAWKQKMNGCDPPWGLLGKKMHDMPSFCCRGWKAPKPVFPA